MAAAAPSLKDMEIFHIQKMVSNINCKLAITTDFHPNKQIFCVITDINDILLHFTNSENNDCLKLISWFRKTPRTIVDVCFDSTSSWLLVLCLDNTVHVVPALKLFEKNIISNNPSFSNHVISSFIIPFVGLRDCTCQRSNHSNESFESTSTRNSLTKQKLDYFKLCSECPHPICLIWWTTIDKRNRAIIGYSDGSICFVELTSNCPVIASISIGNTVAVKKLIICKDNSSETISLLITSSINQQFKLLLEQKCIDYVFPGDMSPTTPKIPLENWQFVLTNKNDQILNTNELMVETESVTTDNIYKVQDYEIASKSGGILPSAKATLASLRVLGTKKINAFRTKFVDNRQKVEDYIGDNSFKNFSIIDSPKVTPELLDSNGGIFEIQHLRHTNLLSILESQACNLSVHSMDTSLIPLFRYKIPNGCREILITSNILYSIEHQNDVNNEFKVSVGVLSSALASIKDSNNKVFNKNAILSVFDFENETVLNILRKSSYSPTKPNIKTESSESDTTSNEANNQFKFYKKPVSEEKDFSFKPTLVSDTPFPKINFDPCYVVTNKNVYYIDLRKEPVSLFLDSAITGAWKQCEEFCEIFDLSFLQCMEFVGDYLLRKKLVTQALLTYNVIRIPPVRTALKLAIHRENYPLMHLCAMALKQIYILKSKYFNNNIIKSLFKQITNLHAEDITKIFEKKPLQSIVINEGKSCSNYKYGVDEASSSLQMTLASQFHISNLLLIALAEKAVRDKNYIPLWNFICTNGKFHTNMTSIVLSQSGLYSSALLLAKVRGTCIDVFLGLTSVLNQEFGFYSELNVCLFNLTDPIFLECLTYLEQVSLDYFNTIQKKMPLITNFVLLRLEQQLYPFSSVLRPKLFNNYSGNYTPIISNDLKSNPAQFSTRLIETYLAVIMQIQKLQSEKDNINNAFSSFNLTYEENKFAINSSNFPALSVGCTHCCYVVNGVAYFWGSNGVPIIFNITNISEINEPVYAVKTLDILRDLNLEIHAVKCGRQHTLMLTNNGVYAFGSNHVQQLGIGKAMLSAQQPVLIEALDYKNITIMEAGQYHNAVVADNQLYTWGWGVYGQLGHGDVENVAVPKILHFFDNKKILKVSLGHAHSLVLCGEQNATELYVFGSNHFGQLGIAKKDSDCNAVKILEPIRLDFGENIININTKFFSNLAVNDSNEIFTWGSSPQALRMANQVKRRENAKHKLSETLKKEIKKRELTEKNPQDVTDNRFKFNSGKKNHFEAIDANAKALETEFQKPIIIISQSEESNNGVPEQFTEKAQKLDSIIDKSTDPKPSTSMDCSNLADNDLKKTRKHQFDASDEKQSRSSENMLHMSPTRVDTERVFGDITNVSSGLFHFALVTSENLLYTWGKNLEHQLGTEDKERKSISLPTQVEGLQNSLYVDCGSDFTVVLTTDFAIKAFGGNTNGQCGMDIKAPMDDYNQNRLFCLPATKRLMLISAPTVGAPHEINIPSPTNTHRTAHYLKSIPKYKTKYINKMKTTSYSEEYHKNQELNCLNDSLSSESSSSSSSSIQNDSKYQVINANCNKNMISSDYIHYCLYIFHGLYDPDNVMQISDERLEYKVRILMLNVKYLDAFSLCLTDCKSAKKATKFFEYFTKDTSTVPIKRHQIKYFIYHFLNFVILNNFNIADCEAFFLADLDYYLLELSFVIYFNNKNLDLEINLYKTFENIFNIENKKKCILFNTEVISDRLSTKFKTIVCQNVIKYYNK